MRRPVLNSSELGFGCSAGLLDLGSAGLVAVDRQLVPQVEIQELFLSGPELCELLQPRLFFVAGPSEIIRSIRTAASGESLVIPAATRRLIERFGPGRAPDPRAVAAIAGLTKREREVLQLVAAGLTNDEITEKLSISKQTVKTHASSVYRQLQVKDRTQAAILAHEAGFVDRGETGSGTE